MVRVGLYVKLQAAPGKESDVEAFLNQGLGLVQEEPGTIVWYALRLGPASFAIFDAFEDESGRDAHLNGRVAHALGENGELFAEPPSIEKLDVIAAK